MKRLPRSFVSLVALGSLVTAGVAGAAPPESAAEPSPMEYEEAFAALPPLPPAAPLVPMPLRAFPPLVPIAPLAPMGAAALARIERPPVLRAPEIPPMVSRTTPRPRVAVMTPPQPPPPTAPSAAPRAQAPASTDGMIAIPGAYVRFGSRAGMVAAFSIDKTEVTVAAYAECVVSGGCPPPESEGFCNWGKPARQHDPINCVSFTDAGAYCHSLGKRLPTELEWEYAARGVSPATTEADMQSPTNACMDRGTWRVGVLRADNAPPAGEGTCAVGDNTASASPFGVEDMLGNVWEWTSSSINIAEVLSEPIVRGGGWAGPRVTIAERASRRQSTRDPDVGFRCAR